MKVLDDDDDDDEYTMGWDGHGFLESSSLRTVSLFFLGLGPGLSRA